jgi:hypothetical protein
MYVQTFTLRGFLRRKFSRNFSVQANRRNPLRDYDIRVEWTNGPSLAEVRKLPCVQFYLASGMEILCVRTVDDLEIDFLGKRS